MNEKFILLIEDNEAVSEALVWALRSEKYTVVTSTNGYEALQVLASGPLPAIIYLDLMMPILDGYEFRKEQRNDTRISDIPTIICSAQIHLGKMVKSPNEIFLTKPFVFKDFLAIVKKYLL